MQTILERINLSLDSLGAPPLMKGRHEYLAQLYGTTTRTIRRWFAQQVIIPKTALGKLAEVLNVNLEWLENGNGCQRRVPSYIELQKNQGIIPILSWDEIDLWLENKYKINYQEKKYKKFLLNEMSESSFVLIVNTIDMIPLIPIETILFIDPKHEPIHDNIVLVQKYDGLIPQIRYYVKKNENVILLQAVAPGVPTTKFTEHDSLIGTVRKIITPNHDNN